MDLTDEITKRAFAARELADLGINASPADVEAYLALTPRQRQQADERWLVQRALTAMTSRT